MFTFVGIPTNILLVIGVPDHTTFAAQRDFDLVMSFGPPSVPSEVQAQLILKTQEWFDRRLTCSARGCGGILEQILRRLRNYEGLPLHLGISVYPEYALLISGDFLRPLLCRSISTELWFFCEQSESMITLLSANGLLSHAMVAAEHHPVYLHVPENAIAPFCGKDVWRGTFAIASPVVLDFEVQPQAVVDCSSKSDSEPISQAITDQVRRCFLAFEFKQDDHIGSSPANWSKVPRGILNSYQNGRKTHSLNKCYFISLMQSLANTSLYTQLENHECKDQTAPCFAKLCFSNVLHGLYMDGNVPEVTLSVDFLNSFPIDFRDLRQQDPEEIFRLLCDAWCTCETRLILTEHVGFKTGLRSVCKNMTCTSVPRESQTADLRDEHNFSLVVHVEKGPKCVQDLVNTYFDVVRVQLKCECEDLKDLDLNHYQYHAIRGIGEVLVVHVKRARGKKDTRKVTLSHKLVLPGCENLAYQLCAVVCHKGKFTANGHYVSLILKRAQWYLANDRFVEAATDKDFKSAENDCVMLFYQCITSDSPFLGDRVAAATASLTLSPSDSDALPPPGAAPASSTPPSSLPPSSLSPSPSGSSASAPAPALLSVTTAARQLLVVLGMSPTCESDKIRIKAFLLSNPGYTVLTVASGSGFEGKTGDNNWVHYDCNFQSPRGIRSLICKIQTLNYPKLCITVVFDFFFIIPGYYASNYGDQWLQLPVARSDSIADLLHIVDAVYLVENKGGEVQKMMVESNRKDLLLNWYQLSSHLLWATSSSSPVTNELQCLNPRKAGAHFQVKQYLAGTMLQIKLNVPPTDVQSSLPGNADNDVTQTGPSLQIMPPPDSPCSLPGNADNDASSGSESADSGSIDKRLALPVRYELLRPCECRRTGRQVIDPRYNQLRDERGNRVFFCKCGDTYRFL